MERQHGIAFRTFGGTNYVTSYFDIDALVIQYRESLKFYGVKWFIINLSSHYTGDRYLTNHTVLTGLNRGSTPKAIPTGLWESGDLPLETFPDRDLFMEFIESFKSENVGIFAYLSGEGPALLHSTETGAYDYDNASPYVDCNQLCPQLTGRPAPFSACSPGLRRWINYVQRRYGFRDEATLQRAYAEVIVAEFAQKFAGKVMGYWMDQAAFADIPLVHQAIRTYDTSAALAFNRGQRLPLTNNNPPYEDFTFGYPFWDLQNYPASDCRNYILIPSQEGTPEGYHVDRVTGAESLGHVFMPILSDWNSGNLVWSIEQAAEWMSRILNADGGWTWNVRRGNGAARSVIMIQDLNFLVQVYNRLPVAPPFNFMCDFTPSVAPTFQ